MCELCAKGVFPLKKQGLGTLAITDRGDRIRTCDLVLPKHRISLVND